MVFDNLTVAEMQAICVIYFLKPKPTGLKAAVVKQVEAYHREHPHVLGDAMQRTLLAAQQAQVEVINRPPSIQAPTCSVITWHVWLQARCSLNLNLRREGSGCYNFFLELAGCQAHA